MPSFLIVVFFFSSDTATTEIYTLSLHDALPIFLKTAVPETVPGVRIPLPPPIFAHAEDRKSTRLNSSHVAISYAVFCLKKKNTAVNGSISLLSIAHTAPGKPVPTAPLHTYLQQA